MTDSPFMRRGTRIGESGRRSERRVARKQGARLRPASGSMAGAKGDMVIRQYLQEAKSTINDSLGVKKEWLDKIEREALARGMNPALLLSFVTQNGTSRGTDWICIRLADYQELLECSLPKT